MTDVLTRIAVALERIASALESPLYDSEHDGYYIQVGQVTK
jgi:hypothetical protein